MGTSIVVIKVKYGETLRRFNACVVGEELDVNMEGLRGKIFSLFNFAPDTELTLTYIDEDGDTVTLADDEDICDVVRQELNPLRITVKLNAEKRTRSYAPSSGSSTPLKSPRLQQPVQTSNVNVADILKSAQEPLHETLVKLSSELAAKASSDLASKAKSSAPGLAELIDHLSKVSLSYLSQLSESRADEHSSAQGELGGNKAPTSEDEGAKGSDGTKLTAFKEKSLTSNVGLQKPEPKVAGEKSRAAGYMDASFVQSALNEAPPLPGFVDFNAVDGNLLCKSAHVDPKTKVSVQEKEKAKMVDCNPTSNFPIAYLNPSTVKNLSTEKEVIGPGEHHFGPKLANVAASTKSPPSMASNHETGIKHGFPSGTGNWSGPSFNASPMSECPFSGSFPYDLGGIRRQLNSRLQLGRSNSQIDGNGSIFHRGVRCDGCGVHPITGPRFKSKVKEDYDLCSICFAEMGNDSEYIRIDRPVNHRHLANMKGFYDLARERGQALPQRIRGCKVKSVGPKLDSRFIQDVNVLDGTVMAPLTPFTKIWRMKNNGNVVWPQKTQLVWIGGDRLSNAFSVELEIPAVGLPLNQELDVAVDFIAPELPGRYISYWRMASPSGQKFGQRVWVLIQVDSSMKVPPRENTRGFNLNLPPVNIGTTGPENIAVDPVPTVESSHPQPDSSHKTIELVEPVVDVQPDNAHDVNFPINDSLLVGAGFSSSVSTAAPSSVSYPVVDLSELPPAPCPAFPMPSPPPATLPNAEASPQAVTKNELEATLLKELEEMGFKQVDLNAKVLRRNEYDLEQSVDDLCGVAEWDPILEELEEMGFHDVEMNKKLLKKNNGSIKRVVMDLIAGDNNY